MKILITGGCGFVGSNLAIFLRKNIPIGAGLAGGSSNAAATLIGLNKLWDLNLDQETLCLLASTLGSDIPFFINGGIQLCFGRGEILEKLDSNFEYGVILLKNPNVSVSTAETYKKYSNRFCEQYFKDFIVMSRHHNINIIVPWNEPRMSHSAKKCSVC